MDVEVKNLKALAEQGLVNTYKKRNYFVIAENNFIRNQKYTIKQKMIYLCLCSYTGNSGGCFPSQESIAKSLNVSIKTVYTTLNELENLGALLIIKQIKESNRRTSNLYILAEIDKDTGMFLPESIEKFKVLKNSPIKIAGK